jgi:hypothetical protein
MKLIALCLGMSLFGAGNLDAKLKKKDIVKTGECPEVVIIDLEGKEVINMDNSAETSRSVPVLDFSNLPTALAATVTDTTSESPMFSSLELSTISTTDANTRVAQLINKDSLMKRYIHAITEYVVNSHATILFDELGSTQIQVWMVDEGVVSNATNELDVAYYFSCCNQKIFNLFIGLADSDILTSNQQLLMDDLYLAINSESDVNVNVAARKYYRIIHPTTTVPNNLPPA